MVADDPVQREIKDLQDNGPQHSHLSQFTELRILIQTKNAPGTGSGRQLAAWLARYPVRLSSISVVPSLRRSEASGPSMPSR